MASVQCPVRGILLLVLWCAPCAQSSITEHVVVKQLQDAAASSDSVWDVHAALSKHKRHKRSVRQIEEQLKARHGPGLRWLSPLTRAWLAKLRLDLGKLKPADPVTGQTEQYPYTKLAGRIWEKYVAITADYMHRMETSEPKVEAQRVRRDGSIFMSVASYRDRLDLDTKDADPNPTASPLGMCSNSIVSAFKFAANPERLFIGVIDQGCRGTRTKCMTGVYRQSICKESPVPDRDCGAEACKHPVVAPYCAKGQVRSVALQENDAMGPMVARWIASQLWRGENYFLQIDAHSVFGDSWDARLIQMLQEVPNPKAFITTYPPGDQVGDEVREFQHTAGTRICGSVFSKTDDGIIRLQASNQWEQQPPSKPKSACFVAAGFFFASSAFLRDAPFDPYLPWAFMGEEILQSARVWTMGWDIYSPTTNVIAHQYTVDGVPRFWETLNRMYDAPGIHNALAPLAIRRIMHILGWPQYKRREQVKPSSMLIDVEKYGIDLSAAAQRKRPLSSYLQMSGINMEAQTTFDPPWCTTGTIPENCRDRLYPQRMAICH